MSQKDCYPAPTDLDRTYVMRVNGDKFVVEVYHVYGLPSWVIPEHGCRFAIRLDADGNPESCLIAPNLLTDDHQED